MKVEVGNTLILKTKDTTVTQDDISQDIYITKHYDSTDKAILNHITDLIQFEVKYIDKGLLGIIEETVHTDEEEDVIHINFEQYETLDEMHEDLFWQDMYMEIEDTIYIDNARNGKWYVIETKYNYASLDFLYKNKLCVDFIEITDEDSIKELNETFERGAN